jgi:purine-binding chemotaxis protein CheW
VSTLHVVFKVGAADYVVPASDVVQMESFTGATKVPGTPDHVSGLVQIRSRVVPVIDVRVRFRLPRAEPTLDSRIVVVDVGGRSIGLLVDSARDIARIPEGDFKPPPEVVLEQTDGFVKSVAQVGDRLLMLVDCQKIVGEEATHVE